MTRRILALLFILLALLWWLWPAAEPAQQLPSEPLVPAPAASAPTARPQSPSASALPTPISLPSLVEQQRATEALSEPPGDWTLRCPITLDPPFEGEVTFLEHDHNGEGLIIARRAAQLWQGQLLVELDNPSNGGVLRVPGSADFRWTVPEDGGCPEVTLGVDSAVVGQILPSWGRLSVRACGTSRPAEEDGSFYVPARPGECTVQAWRSDSGVSVMGPELVVEVPEGGEAEVELSVPEERHGTIGLTLETLDGVTTIAKVLPDSSAEEAGLEPGQIVRSVDGAPAADCDRGWLYSCFHGLAGSTVSLELEAGERLELERR